MSVSSTNSSLGQGIISAFGLGGGLNVTSLVSKLVAAEQDPQQILIDQQEATVTAKLTALGTLQSSLSSFQSSAQALESSSQYLTPTASSSNSSAISATATSAAAIGTHSVSVANIAQAQRIATGDFSSPNTVVGTGTLMISFGSIADSKGNPITASGGVYGTGATPPTAQPVFTANANSASTSIKITSQNNTLAGIASAINNSNAGVTASVVNDGKGYRLVMASSNTGANNSIRVTVADNDGNSTDGSGLSQLSYDVTAAVGSGQNMSETQAAANANLTVDGIAVTSSTNTPSNIINGLTLNLQAATTAAATITVANNAATATSTVQSFVTAYNSLMSSLQSLSNYNASDSTQNGALLGDPVIQEVQSQVQNVMNSILPGGSFTTLSQVGISFTNTGTSTPGSTGTSQSTNVMTLNTAQFTNAMNTDPASVAALFGNYGVSNSAAVTYGASTSTTKPGSYAVVVSQPATQATVAAPGTVSSLNLTSTNNTFSVSVDGVSSGQITLPSQNYASNSALASTLQSQINGDSVLKAAGKSVVVTYDSVNNQFDFQSATYGSASSVSIAGASSDLSTAIGLGATAVSNGQDVAGTIGPWQATGVGQKLTGTGNALGLSVQIPGTNTGNLGTVSYNVGFASQLDQAMSQLLATTGGIQAETAGYNQQMTSLQNQQTQLQKQMSSLQQNYLAEYSAMEQTVTTLQGTGSYLTQQLAALNKSSA